MHGWPGVIWLYIIRYINYTCMQWQYVLVNSYKTQNTPWWGYQLTKTVQSGGPQAISETLHTEYRIVCCIETYLIHIYHMSKCSKCN